MTLDVSLIIAIILGCLALFVAVKIVRWLLKVVLGLIVLAVLGGAVWWLML